MSMSHKDRFKLKNDLVERLTERDWPSYRINLLLAEFGIEQLDTDGWHGAFLGDILSKASDQTLVEIFALVFDLPETEVVDVVESDQPGNWKPGYVRLFISHSAKHKAFVGKVADELAVVGIHGFVAHDTMQVTKPWQDQIEQSLRTMDAFVAFLHPQFNDSAWCHQETGWALGRRVPHFALRMGVDPTGFLGSLQWANAASQSVQDVAELIQDWVFGLPGVSATINDALLHALEEAGDYMSAGSAAARIARLKALSNRDLERLNSIFWHNDQVHGGVLATRELRPFYEANGWEWPPPKPALTGLPPTDASDRAGEEPPF
ncbi:MAG TPA: toll/interleukin-1 receptor domain-containing protein [Acidimicrobiaceae bacterium]|nr:toll/interleukin-1 receptor domain-containing protein [Acidimicrobiaceae bacterium]